MTLFSQQWGEGSPVLALHPLALESTVFAGLGGELAAHGMKTIGVDLPGFGRSEGPADAHSPARLAGPVVDYALELPEKPVLLGMSLGGRVALEAALTRPDAFRGLVLVAPFFPQRGWHWTQWAGACLSPTVAEKIPLEYAWPVLKWIAGTLEARPEFEHDWFMRASARVAYYLSCPATRAHFIATTRDMAADPAFGPDGTWTRLENLALPAAFVWADQDWLIPSEHAGAAVQTLPSARQIHVPCAGHFMNGAHHHCFESAMADAVLGVLRKSRQRKGRAESRAAVTVAACLADAAAPIPADKRRRAS